MPLETIFDEINLNKTKIYVLHSLGTEIGETTQSAIIIPGEKLALKPLEESLIPRLELKYGEKLVNKVMEVLPKFCSTLREEIEERELARTESNIREEKDKVDSTLQITKIPLYPKEKGLEQKPEVRRVIEIPYKISAGDQLYIAIDLCTGLGRPNEYKGELEAIIEVEKGSETNISKKEIPVREKEQEIYGNWRIIQNDGKEDSRMQIDSRGFMIGPKDVRMDFNGSVIGIKINTSLTYLLGRIDADEYRFIPVDSKNGQEVRLIRENSNKSHAQDIEKSSKKQIKTEKIEHVGVIVEESGAIKPPISQKSMDNFERNARSAERAMKRLFGRR